MKTYFEDPTLKVIRFEVKDVLTASDPEFSTEEDELPFIPFNIGSNP